MKPFAGRVATGAVDRDAALPIVLALLAVVALAFAAATLDSTVVPGGGGGDGDGDDGAVEPVGTPGGGDAERLDQDDARTNRTTSVSFPGEYCLPVVREPPALLALALLFVGLFGLVYRATESRIAGLAVCVAVAQPVVLIWGFLAFCDPARFREQENRTRNETEGNASELPEGGGDGSLGDGAVETLSEPTVLLGVLVVAAALVALAALYYAGGDREEEGRSAPVGGEGDAQVEAVGRAAGAAADTIEADRAADNEVYRAWRRMTDALDVDAPETTTPGEFADAAVDAGMDADDVTELTALFEAVRYGGVEASEDRERRAVETLRRIETTYGDGVGG